MQTPYERSSEYSNRAFEQMRAGLEDLPLGDRAVLICGSYARREASENSDVDFFMISENVDADSSLTDTVRTAIRKVARNEPSPDGAFGDSVDRRQMIENIGGEHDDNPSITRRILFLLEGEWLFNENSLKSFRRDILERYVHE